MTFQSDPTETRTRGTVFKAVARLRFTEADLLQQGNYQTGAVYLAGYAIECYLKYAVCAVNEFIWLPAWVCFPNGISRRLQTHDWDILVAAARLRQILGAEPQIEAIYTRLALSWGPSLRYRTKPFEEAEGRQLYRQLEVLYQFLRIAKP